MVDKLAGVAADPFALFREWFEEARGGGHQMPEAMSLATVDETGAPSARMVLLKDCDDRGFVFFTNYESKKSLDLTQNPKAAVTFWWPRIRKQVRVAGTVERVSKQESDAYFETRPRDSQLGAWASQQSRPIPNRAFLEDRFRELERKYQDRTVPRPPHWGGYRIVPVRIEFWVEQPHRMHDRLVYFRQNDSNWRTERLAP